MIVIIYRTEENKLLGFSNENEGNVNEASLQFPEFKEEEIEEFIPPPDQPSATIAQW